MVDFFSRDVNPTRLNNLRPRTGYQDRPAENLTDQKVFQGLSCPECGSTLVREIVCEFGPHYSEIKCAGCDRSLRWGQKPQNVQKQAEVQARISKLLQLGQLTNWERGFLLDIQTKRKLSPKQKACFNRIFEAKGGTA